jgi:uncharacterized RDD family membrane protein YckC
MQQPSGTIASLEPAVRFASVGRRIGAALIDVVVAGVTLGFVFEVLAVWLFGESLNNEGQWPITFLALLVYWTAMEAISGQTVGKALLHIKVVDATTGADIGFWQSLVRNVFKLFGVMLFGVVTIVWISASKTRQRLGDMAAKTIVIPYNN